LTSEERIEIYKEIFHLVYNSNGGFTYGDVYEMPIFLRRFYLRMLIEQKEKENDQAKHQENDITSKSKLASRPPSVRK